RRGVHLREQRRRDDALDRPDGGALRAAPCAHVGPGRRRTCPHLRVPGVYELGSTGGCRLRCTPPRLPGKAQPLTKNHRGTELTQNAKRNEKRVVNSVRPLCSLCLCGGLLVTVQYTARSEAPRK